MGSNANTNHFKRPLRHQCVDPDALFAAGRFNDLIEVMENEVKRVVQRFSGLNYEDRRDAVNGALEHLLTEFQAGKTYGDWPVITIVRRRTAYFVQDMFKASGTAARYGFKVVPLDYGLAEDDDDTAHAPVNKLASRDDTVGAYEQVEFVEAALQDLTPRERDAATRRCLRDQSAEQVADETGRTPNGVDQAYHCAKRKMRSNIERYRQASDPSISPGSI